MKRRNPNPGFKLNVTPGLQVPHTGNPDLDQFLRAVKEHIDGGRGTKGQPKERFATLQELERAGVIKTAVKGNRAEVVDATAESVQAGILNQARDRTSGLLPDTAFQGDMLRFVAVAQEWQPYAFLTEEDGVEVVRLDRLPASFIAGLQPASLVGRFTAELAGAEYAQGSVLFSRVGNLVLLYAEEDIFGASESVELVLSVLPPSITPAFIHRVACARILNDNIAVAGWAEVNPDLTIRFYLSEVDQYSDRILDDGEFSPTGDKGLLTGWSIVYLAEPAEEAEVLPPQLIQLIPDSATEGDPGFTLTLVGTRFTEESVARWGGEDRETTFVSDTELTIEVTDYDLEAPEEVPVTVFDPPPGGGESNTMEFWIVALPPPVEGSLLLSSSDELDDGEDFLLSGDEQSGDDRLLLSGDEHG